MWFHVDFGEMFLVESQMIRALSLLRYLCLVGITFLFSFPTEAGTVAFNYPSFKEALSHQYTQFKPYFRDNYLFDLDYSEKLAARFVAWNEDNQKHLFEVESFLRDQQIVDALKQLANEYARKEYRFRKRKKQKTQSGIECSSNEREKMSFSKEDINFHRNFVSVWPRGAGDETLAGGHFYRMTLVAGKHFPESSPLYPVHQAGRAVFGINRTSIVLTVFADYYYIRDGVRSEVKANTNPTIFWLVLPSWKKVARQGSERTAADYVLDNIKIWLPPLK